MKVVNRYETEDGKTFTDREDAYLHELGLKLRGICNTTPTGSSSEQVFKLTNDIGTVEEAYEEFSAFMRCYRSRKAAQTRKNK